MIGRCGLKLGIAGTLSGALRTAGRCCLAVGLIGFLAGPGPYAGEAKKPKWDVGVREPCLRSLGKPDIWSAADAIGVKLIEVVVRRDMTCPNLFESSGTPYSVGTPEARAKLRTRLRERGKAICAFCAGHRFRKGESDAQAVEWIGRVAEAARDLGVPVIMVPVGGGRGMSDEEFIERGKKFLGALVPIAEKTGVHIALENLQLYWNRVEVLKPVMKTLPTERVGLSHDVTNMYWYGHPLSKIYDMTEAIAPYVRYYCHAKNERYPPEKKNVKRPPGWQYGRYATSIRDGDIDFRRILHTYAKAGFRGVITIEDDSLGHHDTAGRIEVLRDDVKFLREIIAELEKTYDP